MADTTALHLALMTARGWEPGIGDPSIMGWVTVAAYVLAAALCCRRFVVAGAKSGRAGDRLFWLALAAILLLLGVNKQLDLQSWFTQVGKHLAREHGWYEQRRQVQMWFVVGVAAMGVVALGAACLVGRRWWRQGSLALVGLAFLLAFIVVRAASFHHVDLLLRTSVLGVRVNVLLELSGIVCIMVAAATSAWAAPPLSASGRAL